MKADIPFAEYAPDRSKHALGVSDTILNAKPVQDGWGPLSSLAVFSDALAAEPKGVFTGISPSGTIATFAFTTVGAYQLASSGTWTDVDGGATYALPSGDKWSFDTFGSRIIATNSTDGALYWDIGTSAAWAALPGSPPAAKFVRTVGDFVVLGNLNATPNRVVWSGINDTETWTSGVKLSAGQTFPDGGPVHGVLAVTGGALVFQRDLIRMMSYSPSSGFTFTFSYANDKRGCLAPHSIAKVGANDFVYLSKEGFFRGLDNPIGAERVDGTFFGMVDPDAVDETEAAADPFEKIVWFRFKKVDATYGLLGYDWQLNRWFQSDQNTSGFGTFATSGITLEDLDALYPSGLESVPFSLDSAIFAGGKPAFAAFDSEYQLGYFEGPAQAATLETATVQLNSNGRAFVRGAELIGDLSGVTAGSFDDTELSIEEIEGSADDYITAAFSMQVGGQDYHARDVTFDSAASPNEYTGIVPLRNSARLHRFRVNIGAATAWNHAIGVKVDFVAEGGR